MKKLILRWLFGTNDIADYMYLLKRHVDHCQEKLELIDEHKKTLYREKEELDMIRKLIRICENHGIDVDEEFKQIEL